jgi:signal transduction histidine kinase
MFRRIRWMLIGLNVAVLSIMLVLGGTVAYATATQRMVAEIDRNLADRADEMAANLRGLEAETPIFDAEGYRGGFFYLVLGGGGRVLANPQQVPVPPAPPLVIPEPGSPYRTMELNGEQVRVYTRPTPGRPGLLIVGQSLAPVQAAEQRLLVGLLVGGASALLLALLGARFLADRALVPIETAFRRQQEFVADASHELRTPLTVLRASADLLANHRAEPLEQNAELLDDLRSEIVQLERLANDLLTLARSDLDGQALALAPFDLPSFVADVTRQLAPLAQEHTLTLVSEGSDTAIEIEADPDRLRQVLLILIDNAIAHTPPAGAINVACAQQGHEALISVRDTGDGIAPEHLPRLFDRFYRVDRARNRDAGGAGLGLAIAKALIELHGGQIAISSTVGTGTTVTIRLALANQRPTLLERLRHTAATGLRRRPVRRRAKSVSRE